MDIAGILDISDNLKKQISKYFPANFYLPMQLAMDKEPILLDLKQKSDSIKNSLI